MEKRKFEKLGIECSLLGFGCMRFPTLESGKIDEIRSEAMLDEAISQGVNYIDTAYPYHNGDSEPFVGRVLKKHDRSSFYLATKLPMWAVESLEDAERIFQEQLDRLQTEYVDFYLLHAMSKDKWDKAKELKIVEYCEELQKQGKIKYLGFSFHDKYEVFEEMITYRAWDFCQIQLNYMDTEEQAGMKGYELSKKLGIPLVIMEPIKGGSLSNYSTDINQKFYDLNSEASISSYALRWLGELSNVKVILSGMSNEEQVKDNLKTCASFKPLTELEHSTIKEVVEILNSRVQNGCTGCRYCMPCPANVDIPGNFGVWNKYHIYQKYEMIKETWETEIGENAQAKNCIECGKCEKVCPQQLTIREDLKKVQNDLDARRF